MAPVRCNHTCGERRPLLTRPSKSPPSSSRRHRDSGSGISVIRTWDTFVPGAPGARPPLPKRAKSFYSGSPGQETLYLSDGTKIEEDSLLSEPVVFHPRYAGSSLGPRVYIPPPPEVDLERQSEDSDEEDKSQRSSVRKFRDALSESKARVYWIIITMMLLLLGISVGRLMVLERRGHSGVHGELPEQAQRQM